VRPLLAVLVAYALGCIVAAYYVVRLRSGKDVRDSGSGNAGARNVYRSGDRVAAALTLLLDAAKGAAAIQLAIWAVNNDAALALAFVAVIVGHIWPIQLQFRGGKGVAPAIGAGLVLLPRLPLASITLWLGITIGTALVVLAHQRKTS
jgi:acyl phosphate:glycerol-3-phosphate acyltransferase